MQFNLKIRVDSTDPEEAISQVRKILTHQLKAAKPGTLRRPELDTYGLVFHGEKKVGGWYIK